MRRAFVFPHQHTLSEKAMTRFRHVSSAVFCAALTLILHLDRGCLSGGAVGEHSGLPVH